MKKNKETTLFRFVKEECANFNKHHGMCMSDSPCWVLNKKRCGFFELYVLGPADNKHRLPGYDYQKLFAQYADQIGAMTQKIKVRTCPCGCGTSLLPRQRMCDEEKEKRRRASYRKSKNNDRDLLEDAYVKQKLHQQTGIKVSEIPEHLIIQKREQLKIHRFIKKIERRINEESELN